ncbi:MAG: Do family serine endopeptidase, partial [Pseudomonadota bacterium]
IISPDGYVVTNNHVVTAQNRSTPVDTITVTLGDDREFEARIIGRDLETDLALLKVEGENLPYVRFGNSDQVRVGDWVVAIGNPFGLGGTVTAGIVSALQRGISNNPLERFIQTDASINRGNSGGPMFDLNGNVIGINTAIFSPTGGNVGIGFAVPASQAEPVINQLRQMGRVRRGFLGVQIQRVTEDIAAAFGLPEDRGEIVASVEPGGPADKAGIREGDIIVKVNDQEVTDTNNLSFLISNSAIGSRVPIELIRDGDRRTVTATLGERPQPQAAAVDMDEEPDLPAEDAPGQKAARQSLGITLTELTPDIRSQLRLDEDLEGVVVAGVDRNSDAAKKGIGRGAVIVSIDRKPTRTAAEAAAAVAAAQAAGRDTVALFVQRRGAPSPQFVGVKMTARDEE